MKMFAGYTHDAFNYSSSRNQYYDNDNNDNGIDDTIVIISSF